MAERLYTSTFDLDWFSGSQCFIYIGDVWVDEVTSMSYQTSQNKSPIYGYASQYWDDCAAGQIIVQGQFTINFKEQGYLWAVLRRFNNIATDSALQSGEGNKKGRHTKKDAALGINHKRGRVDRRPVWGSNGTRTRRETIERIAQGNAPRGESYQFYNDLSGYATFDVRSPKDKMFEDIAEEFEDQIWTRGIDNNSLNSQIRRPDDIAFDGFDIYMVFGNYSNPQANHTVTKIIDVRIIGHGKQVVIDGKPVQEAYNFIARSTA